MPSLHSKVVQGRLMAIRGDGKQVRNFTSIEDSLRFFEKALTKDRISTRFLNTWTGGDLTNPEVPQEGRNVHNRRHGSFASSP